jgi:hypothetical protein
MSEKTITAGVSIALGVIGLAVIALLVSSQANTSNVFGSLGSAFSRLLCTVTSPITGKKCNEQVTSTVSFG